MDDDTKRELRAIISALEKLASVGPRPLLTIAEMGQRLGVGGNLRYLIRTGRVPGPTIPHGRLKRYAVAEVEAMRTAVETRPVRESLPVRRRREGWASAADMAGMVGVATLAVQYRIAQGDIPAPTHDYPGCPGRYWSRVEAGEVRRGLRKLFAARPTQTRGRRRGPGAAAVEASATGRAGAAGG